MRQPASHYSGDDYSSDHYQDDGRGYDLHGEERMDEPPRRDRRLPLLLLTVFVMALFAGGLWFAYVQGTRHAGPSATGGDGVPVLRADDRPTKVKPEQPGGMPAPDQNISLYNDKPGKPTTEKLLPPPEQPMPRPTPASPPSAAAPPAVAAPAPSVEPAPAAAPAPPAAAPKPAPNAPTETKPPAQAKPVPTETAGGGPVHVRLGSVRTPDAAREEWRRLKSTNADLLGNLKANAVLVDLGDKGIYYRIVAGPVADAAAAERLCAELKQRNHGCILAR